jgi:hypothetical protein
LAEGLAVGVGADHLHPGKEGFFLKGLKLVALLRGELECACDFGIAER